MARFKGMRRPTLFKAKLPHLSTEAGTERHPLLEGLRKERVNPKLSDVIVVVGGTEFKCHRVILAATSEFFEVLFYSNMKESIEGIVTLKGISTSIFDDLLKWMYHGDSILTTENVFDILLAADQLRIETFMEKIRTFLRSKLCLDNCGRVYNASQIRNWVELEKASFEMLQNNFDRVNLSELDTLAPCVMKRLISSHELKTASEDFVVQKILDWVQLDTHTNPNYESLGGEGQVRHLAELLESSRFYLISSTFLCETLLKDALIKSDPKCLEIINRIFCYKTQSDLHQHSCPLAAMHRASDIKTNVILSIFQNAVFFTDARDPYKWDLLKVPFTKEPSHFTGGVYHNGFIYFEDYDDESEHTLMYEYNSDLHEISCCNDKETTEGCKTVTFLPYKDFVIALRTTSDKDIFKIESLKLPCKMSSLWSLVGQTQTKDRDVACTTVMGSRLLIFWKSDMGEMSIECYDLDQHKSFILNMKDKLSSSLSLKIFKKENQVFVLQSDGMLWELQAQSGPPYVIIVERKQLWVGEQELLEVFLVGDVLRLVVADMYGNMYGNIKWDESKSLEDVFKDIVCLTMDCEDPDFVDFVCSIHAVVHNKAVQ